MNLNASRRFWITLGAVVASPALALWLFRPPSPDLQYTVDQKIQDNLRTVTIEIGNRGNAPSLNPSGWVEFPVGEEPQLAVGPRDWPFDVKVGNAWQRLRQPTSVRSSQYRRVYFRTHLLQPGYYYPLYFYSAVKTASGESAVVTVGDDSGRADRVKRFAPPDP